MSRYFIGVAPWYPGPAGPRPQWSAPARTSRHLAHTAITQPVSDGAMDEQITPRRHRLGRAGIVAIVAVVGVLSVGGAVAMATSNGDDPPTTAASSATTVHDHSTVTGEGGTTGQGRRAGTHAGHHDHPALTPYAQRVAAATGAQRQAAADLQAEVRTTLAAYTNVDAAVAAGFRPPRRPD